MYHNLIGVRIFVISISSAHSVQVNYKLALSLSFSIVIRYIWQRNQIHSLECANYLVILPSMPNILLKLPSAVNALYMILIYKGRRTSQKLRSTARKLIRVQFIGGK